MVCGIGMWGMCRCGGRAAFTSVGTCGLQVGPALWMLRGRGACRVRLEREAGNGVPDNSPARECSRFGSEVTPASTTDFGPQFEPSSSDFVGHEVFLDPALSLACREGEDGTCGGTPLWGVGLEVLAADLHNRMSFARGHFFP